MTDEEYMRLHRESVARYLAMSPEERQNLESQKALNNMSMVDAQQQYHQLFPGLYYGMAPPGTGTIPGMVLHALGIPLPTFKIAPQELMNALGGGK